MFRKVFLFIFSILSIAGCIVGLNFPGLHWLYYEFKPLLTTLILLMVWTARKNSIDSAYAKNIFYACVAALVGDIFLMFDPLWCFIGGMISFFVTHIFLIRAFWPTYQWKLKNIWSVILFLFYGIVIMNLIHSSLGVLFFPVLFYMLAILFMCHSGFHSQRRLVPLAALLFLSSDSLIAFNKFYHPIPHATYWVLFPYYLSLLVFLFSIGQKQYPS